MLLQPVRHSVRCSVLLGATVCALAFSNFCAAHAAEPAPTQSDAQRELDRIRSLVLPQQKQWAEKLIETEPDTELARLAQRLLAEYKLFDQLAAEQAAQNEATESRIREYWADRRPPYLKAETKSLTIINRTSAPVLYQIKGPAMGWAGPHRLRPGETHRFYYPVLYRQVSQDGLLQRTLSVGSAYVFRVPPGENTAQLYHDSE